MKPGCAPILYSLLDEYETHRDMSLFFSLFVGAFSCGLDTANCPFAGSCRTVIEKRYNDVRAMVHPRKRA